jgi:hypothetical protein
MQAPSQDKSDDIEDISYVVLGHVFDQFPCSSSPVIHFCSYLFLLFCFNIQVSAP